MQKQIVEDRFRGRWDEFYAPLLPSRPKLINNDGEFQGLCPLHADTDPSLSFNKSTGVWYCHSESDGGDPYDFFARLNGLTTKDDFPKVLAQIGEHFGLDNGARPPQSSSQNRNRQQAKKTADGATIQPRVVATYDYRDPDGKLRYQVQRIEPGYEGRKKSFTQRQPGKREGQWINNVKDVELLLYRLPEIINSPYVFLLEGEKDCDLAHSLKIKATTNSGGAKKLRGQQNMHRILDVLAGKKVYIIPDNDEPGFIHAEQAVGLLFESAKEVRIVKIPNQKFKGDFTDYVNKVGRDRARKMLQQIAKDGPEWESLVKTDNGISLDFPDIMAGVAGDFAGLYSNYLEAPRHFFYMAFLTCLGSVLADTLTLASEISPQPRLFVLLLGESADERKSTAINKSIDLFKDTVQDFGVCLGVGSAEGLQAQLDKKPNLLLALDEFRQFIGKCKIESSVLLPCVNTLFESNRYESHTKKTSIRLERAHLTILAASTIETYERTWDSSFTDIGFNNRLFIVPGTGERKFSFPKKIPHSEKESLKAGLRNILRLVGEGLELDITQAGQDIYHEWYISLDRSIHSKRLDVYALRLMSLLAVNELKNEVDEETVNKAIKLVDWQLEVRRRHDPIDADNNTAKMEEKIRRVLTSDSKSDRELKQRTNATRAGLWFYSTAIKNLTHAKEIRWNRQDKCWERM